MSFKKILIAILSIFVVSNFFTSVSVDANTVFAATAKEQFESGLTNTAKETGHVKSDQGSALWFQDKSLPQIIGGIVQLILSFLGVIFLILMIYGGFIWMTAQGNEQEVSKAKKIIYHSLIGLFIILAAYAITVLMSYFYNIKTTTLPTT